jgi:hypothetical protein
MTTDDIVATTADRMNKSATFHDFCDDHEIEDAMMRPTINGSGATMAPAATGRRNRTDRLQSFGNWVQLFWLKRRLVPGGTAASIHDRRCAPIIRPSVSLCMSLSARALASQDKWWWC